MYHASYREATCKKSVGDTLNESISDRKRIYLDTGASVKGLRRQFGKVQFVLSPYDDVSSRRKDVARELGIHSEVCWNDCNWSWDEDVQPWDEHFASQHLQEIYKIIGHDPRKRRDGFHLDSAYKSCCIAFLTADKTDIGQHRHELEELLGYRIFHPLSELDEVIWFIES